VFLVECLVCCHSLGVQLADSASLPLLLSGKLESRADDD
jgi:hypothetical protein